MFTLNLSTLNRRTDARGRGASVLPLLALLTLAFLILPAPAAHAGRMHRHHGHRHHRPHVSAHPRKIGHKSHYIPPNSAQRKMPAATVPNVTSHYLPPN